MANKIKPENKDVAPASTGKLFSTLYGPTGSAYAKLITAEALVQAREMITARKTTTNVVQGSVQGFNQTVDEPKKHRLPRPDDVMRNQAVMQEMMEVVDLKKKLKDMLGYEVKLDLKPGEKLKEALEQKLEYELKLKAELVQRLKNQGPETPSR
jgi:hypothetical protein